MSVCYSSLACARVRTMIVIHSRESYRRDANRRDANVAARRLIQTTDQVEQMGFAGARTGA
jgi:hypothetical protein